MPLKQKNQTIKEPSFSILDFFKPMLIFKICNCKHWILTMFLGVKVKKKKTCQKEQTIRSFHGSMAIIN